MQREPAETRGPRQHHVRAGMRDGELRRRGGVAAGGARRGGVAIISSAPAGFTTDVKHGGQSFVEIKYSTAVHRFFALKTDARQAFAIAESILGDGGDARRDHDAGKRGAIKKRLLPDVRDAVADDHIGQAGACIKRFQADIRDAVRDDHAGQIKCVAERPVDDIRDRAGNDVTAADGDRILDQLRHALVEQDAVGTREIRAVGGHVDRSQAGRKKERRVTDARHVRADGDRRDALGILERRTQDVRDRRRHGVSAGGRAGIIDEDGAGLVEQHAVRAAVDRVRDVHVDRDQQIAHERQVQVGDRGRDRVTPRQAVGILEDRRHVRVEYDIVRDEDIRVGPAHRDGRQQLAIIERRRAHVRDALCEAYLGEFLALKERGLADGRKVGAHRHCRQGGDLVESARPDGHDGHAVDGVRDDDRPAAAGVTGDGDLVAGRGVTVLRPRHGGEQGSQ